MGFSTKIITDYWEYLQLNTSISKETISSLLHSLAKLLDQLKNNDNISEWTYHQFNDYTTVNILPRYEQKWIGIDLFYQPTITRDRFEYIMEEL